MREALNFGKITDFGKTAADYGRYRAGFPAAFFDRLATLGIGRKGQRVLDLGTGTGTVARGLASRGCQVTGVDKSSELIEEAKRLDAEAGVNVEYMVAPAEETRLPDASFDAVTAGQCWHWFERSRATREVRRLLVNDGSLGIAHFDWLPFGDNVVHRTEELIRKHNPKWNLGSAASSGTGLYPQWLMDVADAGCIGIETFSFDVDVPYSHEGWRGRIRASAGVGASLAPDAVERFDTELARILADRFPARVLQVPHRIWAVVCRSPVGAGATVQPLSRTLRCGVPCRPRRSGAGTRR
jgi:SAM-dependent methyltransferase